MAGRWTRWTVMATVAAALGLGTAQAQEHPRLIVGPKEIAELRAKAKKEPFAAMVAAVKKAVESEQPSSLMYDFRPRNLAALYALTGDKQYAEQAKAIVLEQVNDQEFWNKPGSKGLTRAMGAATVALAFDLCYDAWDDATRKLVSAKLRLAADNLLKSMGAGANTQVANNWQAVRYGAAGLAALASDEPGGKEVAQKAYASLLRHLNANLGDNGWNPEGIGYTQYPWGFTGPFGIAAERAGVGDLRKDTGKKVAMTLWTTYVGTVAIPRVGERLGLRADLSDDHPGWNGEGTAGLAFRYVPADYVPAARWMYDYLCGANGDKSWDTERGGGLYSLLLYPDSVPARNPAEVPAIGLNYLDQSHGLALFRNTFKDENDIVAVVNAHSRQPVGCHGGPDTNTFRIIGLGGCWAVGGGRTGEIAGQTNLFPGPAQGRSPKGGDNLGKLVSHSFAKDGGGLAVATGSCMGTANHQRVFGVDYSGKAGTPAVFVNAETSDNGKLWRLNTPACNKIETAGNTFTLLAPNGATLVGTVLEPAKVTFRTGTVTRDGSDGKGSGYDYRGEKYRENAWVEFDCDKDVLVVMTLQAKGAKAPAVSGTGTARKATFKVGSLAVSVDGTTIKFGS